MSRSQRITTDFMFYVGLATALGWCGAQGIRALTTTEGASLAQYVAFTGGFMIQLVLALEARKKTPGRIISQQVKLFTAWSTCGLALVATVALKGGYQWSTVDTVITILASAGLVITISWAAFTATPLADAAIRAWMNISLKSLPQFLLVWKVMTEGPAGITPVAIVLGSLSIFMRLIPLSISMYTEGQNRDKKWLWISDAVNLASWLSVTIIWLLK